MKNTHSSYILISNPKTVVRQQLYMKVMVDMSFGYISTVCVFSEQKSFLNGVNEEAYMDVEYGLE